MGQRASLPFVIASCEAVFNIVIRGHLRDRVRISILSDGYYFHFRARRAKALKIWGHREIALAVFSAIKRREETRFKLGNKVDFGRK